MFSPTHLHCLVGDHLGIGRHDGSLRAERRVVILCDHKFKQEQKCGLCVRWTSVFSQVLCSVFVCPYDSVRSVTSAASPGLSLDRNRSSRFARLFVADRTFPSRWFRSCFCVSRRSRVLRVSWTSRWAAVFFPWYVVSWFRSFVFSGRCDPVCFSVLPRSIHIYCTCFTMASFSTVSFVFGFGTSDHVSFEVFVEFSTVVLLPQGVHGPAERLHASTSIRHRSKHACRSPSSHKRGRHGVSFQVVLLSPGFRIVSFPFHHAPFRRGTHRTARRPGTCCSCA